MTLAAILALAGWLPAALALIGVGYTLFAAAQVARFFRGAGVAQAASQPVTLLKPLHGAEPQLGANLASFLAQEHHGPVQLVCGVQRADDPAIRVVEDLRLGHPEADIALVLNPARHGANGKVSNLVNMMAAAKQKVLVLSDSDMAVGRDYLPRVLSALGAPGVGAVSCLYLGRGDAGIWSRIGAAMVSFKAMPDMVVGIMTGAARPCMGSTIALRRETLDAIGGFGAFADVLADDHAIGAAVARLGLTVSVPPLLLDHAGDERSFGELWRHFLRWAVTIRGLAPAGHAGSVVTHPLPLALLAMPFHPAAGGALAIAALAARTWLAGTIRRVSGRDSAPLWCIPLGDCIGFAVFAASLFERRVDWRGERLVAGAGGRLARQVTER